MSKSSNKNAKRKVNITQLKKDDIFKYKGEEYIYDGKHVKYDLNQKEIEFANWLSKYYIKSTIMLNPTINVPEGISTADLTIDDKLYDMKIITGSSKQVLYHNMYGKENQASRFIFETSSSKLTLEELESQVENIFERKDMKFVEEICIKKGNKYKIYTRK